jgi:hypothetical protein
MNTEKSWFGKLNWVFQILVIGVPALLLLYGAYSFNLIPGLSSDKSKIV